MVAAATVELMSADSEASARMSRCVEAASDCNCIEEDEADEDEEDDDGDATIEARRCSRCPRRLEPAELAEPL